MGRKGLIIAAVLVFAVLVFGGNHLAGSGNYLDVQSGLAFYYDAAAVWYAELASGTIAQDLVARIDDALFQARKELADRGILDDSGIPGEEQERARARAQLAADAQRDYELLIHAFTNLERARYSLAPLQLDAEISGVARQHSIDMLNNGFFAHVNLQGQDPSGRADAMGVECIKHYSTHYTSGLSENIYHFEGYQIRDVEANAQMIVDGWMNSTGHRENILDHNHDRIGVGVGFEGDKLYATQNFC